MASHTVLLAEVDCQGYEDNLIYCKHDFGENLCTHNKDVLLFCGKVTMCNYMEIWLIIDFNTLIEYSLLHA